VRDTTPVRPETRYAKNGDVNIAYQIVGDGSPDLVAVHVISHIELDWELPSAARFFTRLGSICRLFRVNQRGTGMSDRDVGTPTLETRMDDIRAVLDTAGSPRAVLFGLGDASPLSVLFAATYPERTAGLILMNASPRFVKSPSLPWLPTREETQRQADDFERRSFRRGRAAASNSPLWVLPTSAHSASRSIDVRRTSRVPVPDRSA
jgi:pimeloyl-ACP methyl ester carboxylesterase